MARRLGMRAATRSTSDGYTIVEVAIASVAFLLIVFGAIDFGRSIYLYSPLNNGVREAAREAKVGEATSAERNRPGLANATPTSTRGNCTPGDRLTVDAGLPFSSVTQSFLEIDPITLHSSATVTIE